MAFKLANLVVEISADDGPLLRGLGRVKSTLSATLSGMGSLAAKGAGAIFSAFSSAASMAATVMAASLVAAGAAMAAGTVFAVNAASNLNETVSKTGVVFGESAGYVTRSAQEMADAFGIPKQEFLDAASMFGLIATGMGKTKDQAAETAVHFAKLATDAASSHNISVADALEKIRAGLTGESEPLKALGVLMDEAATKAEALRLGLAREGQELSNAAKFQARAEIITRGLATAHGDLARTADGVANRLRELGGRFQNLAADLGQFLLPETKRLTGELAGAIQGLEGFVRDNEATFEAWGAAIEKAVAVGASAWKHWPEAMAVVTETIKEKVQNVREVFDWLVSNIGPVMDRFAAAVQEGFKVAMLGAIQITKTTMMKVAEIMAEAPASNPLQLAVKFMGIESAVMNAMPQTRPRDFTPLNLSSSPAAEGARNRFMGAHQQDEDIRGAKSLDDLVADGMKRGIEEGLKRAENSTLRGRRGETPDAPKMAGDFRQYSRDLVKLNPWGYIGGGNGTGSVAQAMKNPPAALAAAIPQTKGGISDVDSYARELNEGALKGAEKIAEKQLDVQKSMEQKLDVIAKNTAGSARTAAGIATWG